MMKWESPKAIVQTFVADEYVAVCKVFIDTGIVININPTDGKLIEPGKPKSWNKQGFNDDGFDFLAGEDDSYPDELKGWYGSECSISKIVSGNPKYFGGRYGNEKCGQDNAMAEPVYYFGNNLADIEASNYKTYGVGPNAS